MGLEVDDLKLTDFLDVPTLQEIQDSFAAVAGVKATITDAAGHVLTQAAPTAEFLRRQQALIENDAPAHQEGEFVAPIVVNDQRLGTLRMRMNGNSRSEFARRRCEACRFVRKAGAGSGAGADAAGGTWPTRAPCEPAAIQFLFLLANAIARLCYQEFQLRQRINELTAVYHVAMMLADARDLQQVLNRTVEVVCEVMETKAASLRLIDEDRDELVIKAVYNLSPQYLNKGPIRMSSAEIDKIALSPQGFEYVRNMATDPRVQYPQESRARRDRFDAFSGDALQGKADRRAARLHRRRAGIQPAEDRSAESRRRPGSGGDRKRPAAQRMPSRPRHWKNKFRWPPTCSSG